MIDPSVRAAIARAIAARPLIPWRGPLWRFHQRQYAALDPTGALRYSGRFHRGGDHFPVEATWAALYFGRAAEVAVLEWASHLSTPQLRRKADYRLTEVAADLAAVLNVDQPETFGVSAEALLGTRDYRLPQEFGRLAFEAGAEGLLVPSATRAGANLVVFPANLRAGSALTVRGHRDPRLWF